MSRKKVTTIRKEVSAEQKKARLENGFVDFTNEECQYTIEYTFNHFMVYQEEKRNAKATLDYYRRFYKKFSSFINTFDDVQTCPVAILTKDFGLQALFIKNMGDVNEQTVNNYLRAYRSYGNFCEEYGYVSGFKCPIKEVSPKIKQVYTDSEIDKLLVKPNIDKYEEYRNYVIINLLLATGARCNTIINIKFEDIDLNEGTIIFNTTKANKTVVIPLEKKALRVLTEYVFYWKEYSKNGYLFFNSYGEQLTRCGLAKAIAHYNTKRGVEKTSLHLFRHTFAKRWITSGGDIFELKRILTHSELEMVERYANIYASDLSVAVNKHTVLSQTRTRSGQTVKNLRKNQPLISLVS